MGLHGHNRVLWTVAVCAPLAAVVVKLHSLPTDTVSDSSLFGRDFALSVWAPARALARGINPLTLNPAYVAAYHRDTPAAVYNPGIYLLLAPFEAVGLTLGARLFFAFSLVLTLGTSYLLLARRSAERCAALGITALVIVLTAPSEFNLFLGQPTALMALGLMLALGSVRIERSFPPWLGAVGVALTLLKPQTGLLVVILLLTAGAYRIAASGIIVSVVAAVPGLVMEISATGGADDFATTLHANVHLFNQLNNTLYLDTRIDLPAAVYRITGTGSGLLPFTGLIVGVLVLISRRTRLRRRDERDLLLAAAWFTVIPVYHQQYDALLPLYCLATFAILEPRLRYRALGSAFFAVALAFRTSSTSYVIDIVKISTTGINETYSAAVTVVLLLSAALWRKYLAEQAGDLAGPRATTTTT